MNTEKTSIKAAIPTNDGINIFKGMLGKANQIFVYQIKNGTQFKLIERRNNPYANTMQHLKTLDVYQLIHDCRIIISANIGKKGIKRLEDRGVGLFFRRGAIKEALADVVKNEELKK